MHYLWTALELIVIGILIYFVSGRLIGTKLNFMKKILSAVLSVVFTTFVYWYSYLRHTDFPKEDMLQEVTNISTLVWIGSMLLIAMLFYLILELFDPIQLGERGERLTGNRNIISRALSSWRRQRRLAQVFRIAFQQGIGRTLRYKRTYENDRFLASILRKTLEECGGIFIKFGQVLSTRKDILPPVFIDELSKLQQYVKSMTTEQVYEQLSENLQHPIEEVFKYFDDKPLAAGSIGQVHKAVLKENGDEVIVKILRPDVVSVMNQDLDILLHFANWLAEESSWAENLGLYQLATGFADNLREEINFEIEARNMEQVTNALGNNQKNIKIPKVYKKYSNRMILVVEFLHGVSIKDSTLLLKQHGIEENELLRTIFYSFLQQLLVAGVFHADPHPGNIYVLEETGQACFLDFGAVGRIGPIQQQGFRTLFIGIERNDPKVVLEGLKHLIQDEEIRHEENLLQAISQLLIQLSYLDRISAEELVQSLFTIIQKYELRLYPMVSVALRALITLEGTLNILDTDYDLFSEVKRFTSKNKKEFLAVSSFKDAKDLIEQELVMMLPTLQDLPRRFENMAETIEKGKVTVRLDIFSEKASSTFVNQWLSHFMLLLVGITIGIISVSLLAISQFINSVSAIYLNTASFLGLFLSAIILVRLSIHAIRSSKRV
ncbi:ABC1 kinase family protein [Rummeliibacillus suwonensis]|uniref:ABC1 kinase family protein n=1 Tax=Rummeliibacillus suwonensis TaxID=1306154 RepID=UPI0011B4ABF8|nr:AarF/UbiB family protein [Rummeliibacillus suwonensis]